MIIGKVIGSVVSTRKNENLVGSKFMIVEPVSNMEKGDQSPLVLGLQLLCLGQHSLSLKTDSQPLSLQLVGTTPARIGSWSDFRDSMCGRLPTSV